MFRKLVARLRLFWESLPAERMSSPDVLYFVCVGFFVGFFAGAVVAFFRLTSDWAFGEVLRLTAPGARSWPVIGVWFLLALLAALIVGRLILNKAIRSGGARWIRAALVAGERQTWKKILAPKFVGSWLVMAFGISVGSEGPSIQMGCATALGLKSFNNKEEIERECFVCGGCAAGLAAAFSAPFAGICWVYEIMREKVGPDLFIFMLAGACGVYVSCSQVFGLGTRLPLADAVMPDLSLLWTLLPLGVLSGLVGVLYNYFLRISHYIYENQNLVPVRFLPLFPFLAAALFVLLFPAATGEGFRIFASIDFAHAGLTYLLAFLFIKLFFTAFCYGSMIPAGVMVPLLCLGGVTGAVYFGWLHALGFAVSKGACIALGMAGSFAAAERAPVTSLVLVSQTTAAYALLPALLASAAIGAFIARLARIKAV